MAQAQQVGDAHDGTKCKFREVEVRIFETPKAAAAFASGVYRQ